MRTTLNLPDALMERVRTHARESGRTVTSVVEEALRNALEQQQRAFEPVDFPVLGVPGGSPLVDLADPHQVLDVIDGLTDAQAASGVDEEGAGSVDRLVSELRARRRDGAGSARPRGPVGR